MRYTLSSLILLLAVASMGSCAKFRPTPVVAKVTVRWEGGGSEEVDAGVAWRVFLRNVAHISSVSSAMAVSRDGLFEGYVTTTDAKGLLSSLTAAMPSEELPASAEAPTATLVAGPMPVIEPKLVPKVFVNIDPTKAAAAGVDIDKASRTVEAAISKQKGTGTRPATPEDLQGLTIRSTDGKEVPLTTIATVESRMVPDCIVRHWP